jgi:hypothetical protein
MAVTTHPRLWLTEADLPRLRSWANASNPVYESGLRPLVEDALHQMDALDVPAKDNGGAAYTEFPTEMYAQLFAFMSLIASDEATREDYATRARSLLMHVIEAAQPGAADEKFRYPKFAIGDRSRWHGQAFGLTVDWIYPHLTPEDKQKIRTVFLRWCGENLNANTTDHNHPEPIGVLNNPQLWHLDEPQRRPLRFSANNYYLAHARNIGLMALAFDQTETDDPGGMLHAHIGNVTGAWLYVTDYLLRNDLAGGLSAEGLYYGIPALGRLVQLLLALHTSGHDNPAIWGQQAVLGLNPFWSDTIPAYLHSLSPGPVDHPEFGQVYAGGSFGDASENVLRDSIELFGPLGLYYASTGEDARLEATRWIQMHTAPGGESALVSRVAGLNSAFHQAVLYFMLFDPEAPSPADPRLQLSTAFLATGLNRLMARTGWEADASWLTYKNSWNRIDHQQSDAGMIEFWRKREWLTKGWTGYPSDSYTITCSDYHNTLALENDEPEPGNSIRETCYKRGSQWLFGSEGDPQLTAHSIKDDWLYATGDATNLYKYSEQWKKPATDVHHASRSLVWLKPDHVIIYDRAKSETAGRFKRFWLNVPSVPAAPSTVNGAQVTAVASASGTQILYVTTLLPADAVISHDDGKADLTSGESAEDEPMKGRLKVEAAGGPADARFLHVLQGADTQAPRSSVTMVESANGTHFAGAEVEGTLVLFRVDLQSDFTGVSFSRPSTAARVLLTGLAPGAGYALTETGNIVTVAPNGPAVADQGGVLIIGNLTTTPADSGSVQDTWQLLTEEKNRLETLQSEITASQTKAKQDIVQGQRALTEAGARWSHLAAQIGPLQKLLTDMEVNSQALAKLRARTIETLWTAEYSYRTVLDEVAKTLSPERRKTIGTAIFSVDDQIADLTKKVEELHARAATAEAAVAELQQRAKQESVSGSLAKLLQLPRKLQAAEAEVGRYVAAAEAAASQRRMGEALYLAGELKRATDSLRALAAQESEIRELQQVVIRWQEVHAAKVELSKTAGELDAVRRELADTERELQRRCQERDRDIRAAVAEAEPLTPEAEAPQKGAVLSRPSKGRSGTIARR